MDYILSRDTHPDHWPLETPILRYNMWRYRLRPYHELQEDDVVYLYSSKRQRIEWRTSVEQVERFCYDSKEACRLAVRERTGVRVDDPEAYFQTRPDSGYCLAYVLRQPDKTKLVDKPRGVQVGQHGWLSVEAIEVVRWVAACDGYEDVMLDELTTSTELADMLQELNERMADLPPYRIRRLVEQVIRRDTRMVRKLKEACGHRCQFPACGVGIPKRNGELHVVVHHIRPVAAGGLGVLGNLVVLCPNHHAEFEYGDVEIREQQPGLVAGVLNGKKFEIRLPSSLKE